MAAILRVIVAAILHVRSFITFSVLMAMVRRNGWRELCDPREPARSERPHGRVLPDVHRRAHRTLAVQEERE